MEGYVKIPRSVLNADWAENPNALAIWVRLLLKAECRGRRWNGMVIGRGQLVTTVRELTEETGLTVKQVRTALERLERANKTANKRANKYTLITICDYDSYNTLEETEGQTKGQTKGQTGGKQKGKQNSSVNDCDRDEYKAPEIEKGKQKGKQDLERSKSEPALADNLQSCSNNINHSDNIDPTIENKKNNKENLQKKEEKQKEINGPLLGEEFALTGDDRKPLYDFVSPMFEKAFTTWLDYKRERKESYKSRKSLKVCYTHMVKMSGGSPEMAMAIVEQSMANNWAGLFELKTTTNHGDNRKTREQEREERMRGYTDLVARIIAKGRAARAEGGAHDERK